MKSILCLTVCALSLLAFASTAQSGVAQATGSFQFGLLGAAGAIDFSSHVGADGTQDGQMSFTATIETTDPVTGDPVSSSFVIGAQFDCVRVSGQRAVMSGIVTSSDAPEAVGLHTILVVEDNGQGNSPIRDAFNWGVYEPTPDLVSLTGKDYDYCPAYDPPGEQGFSGMCGDSTFGDPNCDPNAENQEEREACQATLIGLAEYSHLEQPCPDQPASPGCSNDQGPSLTWIAKDFEICPAPTEENPNPPCTDIGIQAGLSTTRTVVSCDSFSPAAYPLNDLAQGSGNILVHVEN